MDKSLSRLAHPPEPEAYEALRPAGPCPKCGTRDAFASDTPTFTTDIIYGPEKAVRDVLLWSCRVCRYNLRTDTLDTV